MRLLGVQRKSDGEILMTARFGEEYKLPKGITIADVKIVTITVPENTMAEPATRVLTPEQMKKRQEQIQEAMKQEKELTQFADDYKIGFGDLVALLTHSTGFKKYWDEHHGGECAPCQERQASWNYFRFKGPESLRKLIKETLDKKGK